jgi:hypothetical protein
MPEKATLVKFGLKEHLLQLSDQGLLYMNNLPHFWKIEDECLRGDPYDSVDRVEIGNHGTIQVKGTNNLDIPLKLTKWTLRVHPEEPERINIFCMFALRPAFGSFPVDEKNFRFGEYALVLLDPQQFINRIHEKLKVLRIEHKANLVEYVPNDFSGRLGPFRKRETYRYQSEWRLVAYKGPGCERKIKIGSIDDISTIIASSEINGAIRIA